MASPNITFTEEELQNEEWRDAVGCEGIYSVSNLGRVRRDAPQKNTFVGRILNPCPNSDGYIIMHLSVHGRIKTRSAHSLVAEAFLGPCPEGMWVNHKDATDPTTMKLNNRAGNLEYVTAAANVAHAIANGLRGRIGQRRYRKIQSRSTKDDKGKSLIRVGEVARMRGCTVQVLKRKAADPEDDFPKPIMDHRGHRKWYARELKDWFKREGREREKTQTIQTVRDRKVLELIPEDIKRFWSYVDKSPGQGPNGDCWGWRGGHSGGYGSFWVNSLRKNVGAHVVAYHLSSGENPSPFLVCHTCDYRTCCRPKHLFKGTNRENILDAQRKGRLAIGEKSGPRIHPERMARGERNGAYTCPEKRPRGETHGNAKLTDQGVRKIRVGIAEGMTDSVLSRKYRIARSTIWAIRLGRAWAHIN